MSLEEELNNAVKRLDEFLKPKDGEKHSLSIWLDPRDQMFKASISLGGGYWSQVEERGKDLNDVLKNLIFQVRHQTTYSDAEEILVFPDMRFNFRDDGFCMENMLKPDNTYSARKLTWWQKMEKLKGNMVSDVIEVNNHYVDVERDHLLKPDNPHIYRKVYRCRRKG